MSKRIRVAIVFGLLVLLCVNFAPFFLKHATYSREDHVTALPSIEKQALPPDWITIPSIGAEAPIQYVDEKDEAVYQEALKDGVVHYPETALPGEPGNMYVFGHSSDLIWSSGSYKTVFALLPKVQEGDEIHVTNAKGDVFTYVVTAAFVINPSDKSVLDQYNLERSMLTVQTSYPLGTALKRYIVQAELDQDEDDSSDDDE